MPPVRIDIPKAWPVRHGTAVGDAVTEALHATMGVPPAERFQVVTAHPPDPLSIDPSYLGIRRSADAIIVQVFPNGGRDAAIKRRFYTALADGLRREDLVINLAEVKPEDWSFGNGEAHFVQ